ncbi:hypothetical protein V2A60_006243 [Cordyceps javanica]|uniref:Uncharacterized protein n=1 Tax=Cordyceps javanica TaxID=43265 RepID=A0A545V8K8_9HYPO|nr:hypothetical protein IF1G_03807 [Cordyceps javanica]TQW08765.1 hypothetical protein IF2G_03196 [Cordyceps javanica]
MASTVGGHLCDANKNAWMHICDGTTYGRRMSAIAERIVLTIMTLVAVLPDVVALGSFVARPLLALAICDEATQYVEEEERIKEPDDGEQEENTPLISELLVGSPSPFAGCAGSRSATDDSSLNSKRNDSPAGTVPESDANADAGADADADAEDDPTDDADGGVERLSVSDLLEVIIFFALFLRRIDWPIACAFVRSHLVSVVGSAPYMTGRRWF